MSAEISESSSDTSPAAEANGMMSFWMQFFRDAGIPASEVENYSIMFVNHRIQKHMLLDLNKEYLVEMGITAMGDIIAVLKQAKVLQSKPPREVPQKMKPTSSDASAPETPLQRRVQRRVRPTPASEWFTPTPAPRSTPVSRIVGHYLGKDPDARPMTDTTPPMNRTASPDLTKRLCVTSSDSANRKSSVFSRLGTSTTATGTQSTTASSARSRLGTSATATGTQSTASSARSRLGLADKAANMKITINATSSAQKPISDLRGVLKRPATTTCRDSDDSSVDSACEYAGVLKKSRLPDLHDQKSRLTRPAKRLSRASSSANTPSEGIFSVRAKQQSASVKQRLGQKQI